MKKASKTPKTELVPPLNDLIQSLEDRIAELETERQIILSEIKSLKEAINEMLKQLEQ